MRKIATLNNGLLADTFRWYLYAQGIETKIDVEDGDPDVWVMNDNDLPRARVLLAEFEAAPSPLPFEHKAIEGKKRVRGAVEKKPAPTRFKTIEGRTQVFHRSSGPSQTLFATPFLVIVCVAVFVLNFFDTGRTLHGLLSISQDQVDMLLGMRSLPEVRSGQVWRLLTPIFIHNDLMHIVFNMLWLFQFGRMIENVKGTVFLFFMVALVAIPSNMAFYFLVSPAFGGMSGVIYGMVFYMWLSDRLDPPARFGIEQHLVNFFLIYYVLCWVLSAVGFGVANTVHGMGAFMGCVLAIATTPNLRFLNRRSAAAKKELLYNALIGLALLAGAFVTDYLVY